MLLRKAHVTNFKNVEDSDEFTLDRVTCLVGKNESGKTSLLESLYRLNPYYSEDSKYDKIKEYPRRFLTDYEERHKNEDARVVTTQWEIEDSDVTAVEAILGSECLKSTELTIYKKYCDDSTIWSVPLDESQVVTNLIERAALHTEESSPAREYKTVTALKKYLDGKTATNSEREKALLEAINKFRDGSPYKAAIDALSIPKFVSFADYDIMTGNVAVDDLLRRKTANPSQIKPGEKVFLAFLALVGTSLEEINKIDKFEPLQARLEAASNKITRDVFEYWTQNRNLRVVFTLDAAQPGDPPPFNQGKILHTRIYNTLHESSVNFDERSRGFVWFFSFLVLFSQVKKDFGKNVIVLLDEPGLSLHAKAQGDLLRYIDEKLKPYHQVIYTTHSPFMVDPANLTSIRTVEDVVIYDEAGHLKEIVGAKVGDEVLSTDRDTLFPLQGALGYEITQTLFVGKHSLLIEGPSDLLYLAAFSNELKNRNRVGLDPRWTLTPIGGVDKVSAFMSLLTGNRLHVAILIDYAKGQKKKVEDLRRSRLLKDNHVLTFDMFTGKQEADVEDMIGWKNYISLVNACYGLQDAMAINDPEVSSERVVKRIKEKFSTMPPSIPEFDHYAAAEYLTRNSDTALASMPDLDEALERFEKVFTQLNKMLPAIEEGRSRVAHR